MLLVLAKSTIVHVIVMKKVIVIAINASVVIQSDPIIIRGNIFKVFFGKIVFGSHI